MSKLSSDVPAVGLDCYHIKRTESCEKANIEPETTLGHEYACDHQYAHKLDVSHTCMALWCVSLVWCSYGLQ